MKRVLAYLLILASVVLMAYWYAEGASIFTMTEKSHVVEEKDEIFGTTTQKTVWEKDFTPGLEYTGPVAGVLFLGGVILLWRSKKKPAAKRSGPLVINTRR